MSTLTRKDVITMVGEFDDVVVAKIIATGATTDELVDATVPVGNEFLVGSKIAPHERHRGELCVAGRNRRMLATKLHRKQTSFLELGTPECVPRTENRCRDHGGST
jgi:hypothetical protein